MFSTICGEYRVRRETQFKTIGVFSFVLKGTSTEKTRLNGEDILSIMMPKLLMKLICAPIAV